MLEVFFSQPTSSVQSFLSVWAKYLGELLAHVLPTCAFPACVSSIMCYAKARHNMRQEQTTQPAAIGCLVGLLPVKVSCSLENEIYLPNILPSVCRHIFVMAGKIQREGKKKKEKSIQHTLEGRGYASSVLMNGKGRANRLGGV